MSTATKLLTNPYVLGGGALVAVILIASRGGGGGNGDVQALNIESQKIGTAANVALGQAAIANETERARIRGEAQIASIAGSTSLALAAIEAAIRNNSIIAAREVENKTIDAGVIVNRDNNANYQALANIQTIGQLKALETSGLIQTNVIQAESDAAYRMAPFVTSMAEASYRSAKDIATLEGVNTLRLADISAGLTREGINLQRESLPYYDRVSERQYAVEGRRLDLQENASRRTYEAQTGGSTGRAANAVNNVIGTVANVAKIFGF